MKTIASVLFSLVIVSGAAAFNDGSGNGWNKTNNTNNTNNSSSCLTEGKTSSSMMSDASYMVVTGDSRLSWIGRKVGGEHFGTVSISEGAFRVSNGEMLAGDFVIDMTSITNDDIQNEGMNKRLVNHLKSEDFFNTGTYPKAYFRMKEGKFAEGDDRQTGHYEVTGTLTIKDISHEIGFNAYICESNGMIKTDEIVLDRTKWDVNFKSRTIFAELADDYIYDEMYITVELAVE
jgi:polyisoprenoid-binding protein YceI